MRSAMAKWTEDDQIGHLRHSWAGKQGMRVMNIEQRAVRVFEVASLTRILAAVHVGVP